MNLPSRQDANKHLFSETFEIPQNLQCSRGSPCLPVGPRKSGPTLRQGDTDPSSCVSRGPLSAITAGVFRPSSGQRETPMWSFGAKGENTEQLK